MITIKSFSNREKLKRLAFGEGLLLNSPFAKPCQTGYSICATAPLCLRVAKGLSSNVHREVSYPRDQADIVSDEKLPMAVGQCTHVRVWRGSCRRTTCYKHACQRVFIPFSEPRVKGSNSGFLIAYS
jgi:hypothetical protein